MSQAAPVFLADSSDTHLASSQTVIWGGVFGSYLSVDRKLLKTGWSTAVCMDSAPVLALLTSLLFNLLMLLHHFQQLPRDIWGTVGPANQDVEHIPGKESIQPFWLLYPAHLRFPNWVLRVLESPLHAALEVCQVLGNTGFISNSLLQAQCLSERVY